MAAASVEGEKVSRKAWLAAALAALALSIPSWTGGGEEQDERYRALRGFLEAYLGRNMERVRECAPNEPDHLFGAYLFDGKPELGRPKVDKRQALIEFSGKTTHCFLPAKGGLLCYREKGVWKVRQVLFYDKVPSAYQLPKRSATAKDRAEEPQVTAVGRAFLDAWQKGDAAAISSNWYNWTKRSEHPIRGLSAKNWDMSVEPLTDHEAFGTYHVKLVYRLIGIPIYSAKVGGGVFLVKEGGEWKVRGNVMLLSF